jgi:hypothetical protein
MPEVVGGGAPAPEQQDPFAKIEAVGQGLAELSELAPELPEGAQAALKAALDAFSAFAQEVQGGGAEPQQAPVDSMGGAQGVPMDQRRTS